VVVSVVAAGAAGVNRWVAAGNAANTTAAAPATPNPDCTIIVPASPLTARGLAAPYRLTATNPADGPCNEANQVQTAFVQGAVIDPATGSISIYDPLVIDAGTRPARSPVVPRLPKGAIVAVWFGYNGNVLTLRGAGHAGASRQRPVASASASPATTSYSAGGRAAASHSADGPAASAAPDATLWRADCVAGQDIAGHFTSFSQVAACNAAAFFKAANKAIEAGKLHVRSPGTAKDGMPCLTTRSFALIDQDQSDNVTTEYLANSAGQVAQDTAASERSLGRGAVTLFNGSDNGLLDFFVDPALGCAPWTVPDLANAGAPATGLPLDELQSAQWAGKVAGGGPEALVPLNDPMTVGANGHFSTAKAGTYRSIMDMPPLPAGQSPKTYCADMEKIQGRRLQQDVNLLIGGPSPAPGTADNLFTFLSSRLQASFANLNCGSFGMKNDVTTTVNRSGVVVAACFAHQVAAITQGPGNPTKGMTSCPPATSMPSGSASPSPTAATSTSRATSTSPATSTSAPAATPATVTPSPASPTAEASPAGSMTTVPAPGSQQSPVTQQSQQVPTAQPLAASRPTLAPGPGHTGSAASAGRGWHDSGWSATSRGDSWPGLGSDWARPNPRQVLLSAILHEVLPDILHAFLPGPYRSARHPARCRRAP
jgi:hypothetical protein